MARGLVTGAANDDDEAAASGDGDGAATDPEPRTAPATGTLYIVSTPIGNLGDFTMRAIETLQRAAVVLAEDTRHSRPLLQRFAIETPLQSYHEHNEARATAGILARLERGDDIALISDAGTPLLSDPGARLVAAAAAAGHRVSPVPGASALLAALVTAGIPADRFTFYGFLERKGRERAEAMREIAALRHTAVLYESPHRIGDTLAELALIAGAGRRAAVARELTKQFEEIRRGTLGVLATYYESVLVRGELVLVVEGAPAAVPATDDELRARAGALRSAGASRSDIAAALTDELGAPRNVAYRIAHEGGQG